MDTTESLGYLKGLLDGMDLDESKKETKIYRAMIGVLENLAEDVNDLPDRRRRDDGRSAGRCGRGSGRCGGVPLR